MCSFVVEASEATSCTPVSMRVWKVMERMISMLYDLWMVGRCGEVTA